MTDAPMTREQRLRAAEDAAGVSNGPLTREQRFRRLEGGDPERRTATKANRLRVIEDDQDESSLTGPGPHGTAVVDSFDYPDGDLPEGDGWAKALGYEEQVFTVTDGTIDTGQDADSYYFHDVFEGAGSGREAFVTLAAIVRDGNAFQVSVALTDDTDNPGFGNGAALVLGLDQNASDADMVTLILQPGAETGPVATIDHLASGDQIGLSIANGIATGWVRRVGEDWEAVVSAATTSADVLHPGLTANRSGVQRAGIDDFGGGVY